MEEPQACPVSVSVTHTGHSATATPSAAGGGSSDVNRATAWEGCSVLLDINDGDRLVFARLSPSAIIKIGNKNYSLNPLVGCPFGSLFSVETSLSGPYLARCAAPNSQDKREEDNNGKDKDEIRDNRALVDNNTAQSLSSEDIETMRMEGASGEEIVKALITNSATFEKKTAFSQEKYKLKKQKKYAPKVLLRRPSMRSICETYFKKHPQKTGFMRVDTLSLILCMANVGPHSDALIFDKIGGLIVGSVAERVGSTGYVCSTYFGSVPNIIDIVRMFNFNNDVSSRILQAPFSELSSSLNDVGPDPLDPLEISEPDPLNDLVCKNNNDGKNSVKPSKNASPEIIKSWKNNGFTSLIIAVPEMDVESLVMDLLPLLAYSAPFVIYHQYLQPLATCMRKLQTLRLAIGLQINEPWLREYQVLPSRTHPHMQMNAFGGYILSGVRICNSEASNNNEDKMT